MSSFISLELDYGEFDFRIIRLEVQVSIGLNPPQSRKGSVHMERPCRNAVCRNILRAAKGVRRATDRNGMRPGTFGRPQKSASRPVEASCVPSAGM